MRDKIIYWNHLKYTPKIHKLVKDKKLLEKSLETQLEQLEDEIQEEMRKLRETCPHKKTLDDFMGGGICEKCGKEF